MPITYKKDWEVIRKIDESRGQIHLKWTGVTPASAAFGRKGAVSCLRIRGSVNATGRRIGLKGRWDLEELKPQVMALIGPSGAGKRPLIPQFQPAESRPILALSPSTNTGSPGSHAEPWRRAGGAWA